MDELGFVQNEIFKFVRSFIKSDDNNDSDIGYFLDIESIYSEQLEISCSDLFHLCEKMRTDKFELLFNLKDKKRYIVHTLNLQQASNHGLVIKFMEQIYPEKLD